MPANSFQTLQKQGRRRLGPADQQTIIIKIIKEKKKKKKVKTSSGIIIDYTVPHSDRAYNSHWSMQTLGLSSQQLSEPGTTKITRQSTQTMHR